MELPESLKKWSYDELAELNKAIVAHLKERNVTKAQFEMRQFRRGNIVEFWSSEGDLIKGTVIRLNKKTVSIVTAEGTQWNVSPSLLVKNSDNMPAAQDQEVIDFMDKLEG